MRCMRPGMCRSSPACCDGCWSWHCGCCWRWCWTAVQMMGMWLVWGLIDDATALAPVWSIKPDVIVRAVMHPYSHVRCALLQPLPSTTGADHEIIDSWHHCQRESYWLNNTWINRFWRLHNAGFISWLTQTRINGVLTTASHTSSKHYRKECRDHCRIGFRSKCLARIAMANWWCRGSRQPTWLPRHWWQS